MEDFTTRAGGTPSTTRHPSWCDRQDCDGRGEHRSREFPANPSPDDMVEVFAALIALFDHGVTLPVMVAITFAPASPDDHSEELIELGQATALARQLYRLVDLAGGR